MGRKGDISSFLKGQICALRSTGNSQSKIAKQLKISRCAVQNALHAGSSSNRERCGRKRVTSGREDRLMKKMIIESPHTSSARIAQVISERGKKISSRTVRRRLSKDFKLVARRPAKKPLLTATQLQARMTFCKAHLDKTVEWWEQVMFSDESTFQQIRSTGYNYVRRPEGERLNPKYTIKSVKHPPTVMVWGAISAKGRGGLHIFSKGERVNATKYISVLSDKLKTHMDVLGATTFQQDSAPCHTAKVVKKWFTTNGITLLQNWPSSSPDLNCIENCWNVMKAKVAAHRPTSEEELKKILKQVWATEITPEYCKSLVHSMPRRIKAVLDNKGHPTKY
jgi:transposase